MGRWAGSLALAEDEWWKRAMGEYGLMLLAIANGTASCLTVLSRLML